jgi:hypothetical protein
MCLGHLVSQLLGHENGIRVRKNLKDAVHDFKFAVDQADGFGQLSNGACLQNEIGVSIDLVRGVHYLKLSAHQGPAADLTLGSAC